MRGPLDQRGPRVPRDQQAPRVSVGRRELGDPVLPGPRDLLVRKDLPDLPVRTELTVSMEHRAHKESRGRKDHKVPQVLPGLRARRDLEGSLWTTPPAP